MKREVKHYHGEEIDLDIFTKLFGISAQRNFRVEGLIPYSDINTLEDVEDFYGCCIDAFHIILGEDWYITYLDYYDSIEILEWCSVDNKKDIYRQTLEMMKYMISIFIEAKDKKILTIMRHTTSYKFYELLKSRGYIEEQYDSPGLDSILPLDIFDIIDKLIDQNINIKGYLLNENRPTKYDKYFYHELIFRLNDSFFKKYEHCTTKNK